MRMTNFRSPLKLKTQLLFIVLGLLTLLPWIESIKKAKPQWFVEWDELPFSSRESRKRVWFVVLLTIFSFFALATFEQVIKSNITVPHTVERAQEPNKLDECPVNFSIPGIYCLIIKSELLKLAETFSIVVAAWLFILDRRERKEQAQRDYWSLIDGAKGSQTSGARHSAIERLHQEKVSLKGLDAEGADLQGINLEGANLERSNLQQADLESANLNNVNLIHANLQDANLKQAQLQEAELWQADLRGANLRDANLYKSWLTAAKLHRAILKNANLEEADLRGSRFYDVDFRGANLENADLEETEFVRVRNLTLEQVQKAKNWENAQFSQEWYPNNTNILRKTKEYIVPDGDEATDALNKLNELRDIENLIDSLSQKRYMSKKEFNDYLKSQQFQIPEVENLRELIILLEDLQDAKKIEIEEIIEEINQDSNRLRAENNHQDSN
jgi:uncharacterized protein YjbI with pentapeptide repeats